MSSDTLNPSLILYAVRSVLYSVLTIHLLIAVLHASILFWQRKILESLVTRYQSKEYDPRGS